MKKILLVLIIIVFAGTGAYIIFSNKERQSRPETAIQKLAENIPQAGNETAKDNISLTNVDNRGTSTPMPGSDRDEHGCIGSAGYTWCKAKQKCLRVWEERCDTADFNFIKSGIAAKNLPGLEKDKLYIMYEEPGKPGLYMQLSFDEKSLCGDAKNKIVCMALSVSDYGLDNGRRIKIGGIKKGNTVLVGEMELGPLPE